MDSRIVEFEGVRAVLALWVLIYHVFAICGLHVPQALTGEHAVEVFFALSGFVISLLLDQGREEYGTFILRRLLRIFPAYAVCVAASAVLVAFEVMPRTFDAGTEAIHAGLHFIMFHGAVPKGWLLGTDSAFLNPAWSVSVEWQFYLLVPAFFVLYRQRQTAAWLTLFVVAAASRRLSLQAGVFGGASLALHVHLFAFGMVSYFVYRWAIENQFGRISPVVPFALVLLPLPVLPIAANLGVLLWFVAFGIVLSKCGGRELESVQRVATLLRSPLLVRLGAISYALYLVHEPVVWLSRQGVRIAWPGLDGSILALAVGALSLPFSILAAIALHKNIELPFIRLGKRFANVA